MPASVVKRDQSKVKTSINAFFIVIIDIFQCHGKVTILFIYLYESTNMSMLLETREIEHEQNPQFNLQISRKIKNLDQNG